MGGVHGTASAGHKKATAGTLLPRSAPVFLCRHTGLYPEVLAETACCREVHVNSNLFDRIIGIAKPVLYFAQRYVADKGGRSSACNRIAEISQILGGHVHPVGVPRDGIATRVVFFQEADKLSE